MGVFSDSGEDGPGELLAVTLAVGAIMYAAMPDAPWAGAAIFIGFLWGIPGAGITVVRSMISAGISVFGLIVLAAMTIGRRFQMGPSCDGACHVGFLVELGSLSMLFVAGLLLGTFLNLAPDAARTFTVFTAAFPAFELLIWLASPLGVDLIDVGLPAVIVALISALVIGFLIGTMPRLAMTALGFILALAPMVVLSPFDDIYPAQIGMIVVGFIVWALVRFVCYKVQGK